MIFDLVRLKQRQLAWSEIGKMARLVKHSPGIGHLACFLMGQTALLFPHGGGYIENSPMTLFEENATDEIQSKSPFMADAALLLDSRSSSWRFLFL